MFKLVKILFSLVLLISFGYVLFFVPLGSRTLYQHLRNISNTDEAQQLRDGLTQKANMVTNDVVDTVPELKKVDEKVTAVRDAVVGSEGHKSKSQSAHADSSSSKTKPVNPVEVSGKDRAALNELLKSKLK